MTLLILHPIDPVFQVYTETLVFRNLELQARLVYRRGGIFTHCGLGTGLYESVLSQSVTISDQTGNNFKIYIL